MRVCLRGVIFTNYNIPFTWRYYSYTMLVRSSLVLCCDLKNARLECGTRVCFFGVDVKTTIMMMMMMMIVMKTIVKVSDEVIIKKYSVRERTHVECAYE